MSERVYKTNIQFFESDGKLAVTVMSPKTGRFLKLEDQQICKLQPVLALKIRMWWQTRREEWIGSNRKIASRVFKLPMTTSELQDIWRVYTTDEVVSSAANVKPGDKILITPPDGSDEPEFIAHFIRWHSDSEVQIRRPNGHLQIVHLDFTNLH